MNIFKKLGWGKVSEKLVESKKLTPNENGEISEKLHNYGWILSQYADGHTTEELKGVVGAEVISFMDYIKKTNLTLPESVAVYDYSVNSSDIIKASKYKEEWAELKYLDTFKRGIGRIKLPESDKAFLFHKVTDFIQNFDFEGKTQDDACYDFIDFCNENNLPPIPMIEHMVENIYQTHRTYQNAEYLSEILKTHEITEEHTYYRGVNSDFLHLTPGNEMEELKGMEIINDFPTSTSSTFSGCFKGDGIDLILEIHARPGTKGLDVTCLSHFAEREMETLFAKNEMYVTDVRQELINGQMKFVATCEMSQRALVEEIQRDEKEGRAAVKCDLDYTKGYATITRDGLIDKLPIIDTQKFKQSMEISYKDSTYIPAEPKVTPTKSYDKDEPDIGIEKD